MKLDSPRSRVATMATLDAITQKGPDSIDRFFTDRNVDPDGVVTVSIEHAHAYAHLKELSGASLAALFAGGVALGLVLAEQTEEPWIV